MPESKKSPLEVLEEKISTLEQKVEELSQRPIAKVMYKPPGSIEHMELAAYLNAVENRLNTIELRQDINL